MKNTIFNNLIRGEGIMILLLLAACNLYLEDTKVHYDVPEELEGQVLFVTKGNEFFKASTKAPTTVTSNLNDGFNVAIDRNSSHNNLFIGEFSKDGQFWKGDCFWPNSDQQYRFFAVYPKTYDLTYVSTNSVGQGYTIHASTEDDIVCASLTNPDYKEVNELNFEHIFGKIVAVKVTADEGYDIKYCYIWLYPVTEGDYNLLSNAWSSKTESSERVLLLNNTNINAGQTYTKNITESSQTLLVPGKYIIHASWTADKGAYGYSEVFTNKEVIVDIPAGAASTLNISFTGNAPVVQVSANVENWAAYNIDNTTIKVDEIPGIGKFTTNANGDQITFSPGILEARISGFVPTQGNGDGYNIADDWRFSPLQGTESYILNETAEYPPGNNYFGMWCSGFEWITADSKYDSFGLIYTPQPEGRSLSGTLYGLGLKTDFGEIPNVSKTLGMGWRSPSCAEYEYILNQRETGIVLDGFDEQNVRFTVCQAGFRNASYLTNIKGYLIFPDDFDGILPEGATINNVNLSGFSGQYFSGTLSEISESAMNELQTKGCVFLARNQRYFCVDGMFSAFNNYNSSYPVRLYIETFNPAYYNNCYTGSPNSYSHARVRLVKDIPKIDGSYTINLYGEKVNFAPGNLQYQAATNTWRFAEHQWDYIGNTAGNNTADESVRATQPDWIDLFGWGTSGHAFEIAYGANYHPYDIATTNNTYGPPGYSSDLINIYSLGDWGQANNIFYDATDADDYDPAGTWRTLTRSEWDYLLFRRGSNSNVFGTRNARFTNATIRTDVDNGINGCIIFPDNCMISTAEVDVAGTVNSNSSFSTKCSEAQWAALEAKGCTFLPTAGYRFGTTVNNEGYSAYYWSSTSDSNTTVEFITISYAGPQIQDSQMRQYGACVRLVKPSN